MQRNAPLFRLVRRPCAAPTSCSSRPPTVRPRRWNWLVPRWEPPPAYPLRLANRRCGRWAGTQGSQNWEPSVTTRVNPTRLCESLSTRRGAEHLLQTLSSAAHTQRTAQAARVASLSDDCCPSAQLIQRPHRTTRQMTTPHLLLRSLLLGRLPFHHNNRQAAVAQPLQRLRGGGGGGGWGWGPAGSMARHGMAWLGCYSSVCGAAFDLPWRAAPVQHLCPLPQQKRGATRRRTRSKATFMHRSSLEKCGSSACCWSAWHGGGVGMHGLEQSTDQKRQAHGKHLATPIPARSSCQTRQSH